MATMVVVVVVVVGVPVVAIAEDLPEMLVRTLSHLTLHTEAE